MQKNGQQAEVETLVLDPAKHSLLLAGRSYPALRRFRWRFAVSNVANWSYTATATIWRKLEGNDEYGDPLGYAEPEQILCDYEGGLSKKLASLGAEIVVKNTVWTEFSLAATGDYLMIGVSTEADPIVAGADEVRQVIRYADTFERVADDYAILTGV